MRQKLALICWHLFLCQLAVGQISNNLNSPLANNPSSISNLCSGFRQSKLTRLNQEQPTTDFAGPEQCYDNMYVFGPNSFGIDIGDMRLNQNNLEGTTIDLRLNFPYYGGMYNYTIVTGNGHIAFATNRVAGLDYNLGPEGVPSWPEKTDPALIGQYLCKQQLGQNTGSNVWYKLIIRTDLQNTNNPGGSSSNWNPLNQQPIFNNNGGNRLKYIISNKMGDRFLTQLMKDLQEGMVGGSAFRPDAALVITWENMVSASNRGNKEKTATYQTVLMTDRAGTLGYAILNYDHLNFAAADVNDNSKMGRCKPVFNGGNHTGTVLIDPSGETKADPRRLAQVSGVPHVVRGRHMFRVDDVVRRGGCTNKTGGTYPMMIYPNIVNMLGEMTVDVNGMCLSKDETYVLMIAERPQAQCKILNSAIARCSLPKVLDWGTKEVYLQSQNPASLTKAFVGYIYFVPPTFDPMRLEIGSIHDWFKNPIPMSELPLKWYPRNFTNPNLNLENSYNPSADGFNDISQYATSLDLYVVGYREAVDISVKKFIPQYRIMAKLNSGFANLVIPILDANTDQQYGQDPWKMQSETLRLSDFSWYGSTKTLPWEEIYKYRFGFLKLVARQSTADFQEDTQNIGSGLVSPLIPLHWLWQMVAPARSTRMTEQDGYAVEQLSAKLCQDWYDIDGQQYNFIRDTETNSSCPCVEEQAKMDLGRFMPHPRCSNIFRNVYCTVNIGARNCYMSASNVYGSYSGAGNEVVTHYGQVCCYDDKGFLMHTSYQPVIKVSPETPYSPGFPQRAFEFGTEPYQGQFQIPGMSSFYHDQMPYFFCCKWAKFRCQMFYWRRPSSGCQEYRPPAVGSIMGSGHFVTTENKRFTYNEPGVFTLFQVPAKSATEGAKKEVNIQVRLEQYPDRTVDYSRKDIDPADLVVPVNSTVVTGIALEGADTDRVQIVLRKDTRRQRYRTTIVVNGVLRYFDAMTLQRYRGILIYVNDVQKGQAEVYVVMEKEQIGLRIRESYAMDIDVIPQYFETPGVLDVTLAVPSQYNVNPNGFYEAGSATGGPQPAKGSYGGGYAGSQPLDKWIPQGLLRPYTSGGIWQGNNTGPLTDSGVDGDTLTYTNHRTLIEKYLVSTLTGQVPTGGPLQFESSSQNYKRDTINLFTIDEDRKVWPGAALVEQPTYKAAARHQYRFTRITTLMVREWMDSCSRDNGYITFTPGADSGGTGSGIPINMRCKFKTQDVEADCNGNRQCEYDYVTLAQELIASRTTNAFQTYIAERSKAVKHYPSCGPMNVEYPEYLKMTPTEGPKYLHDDSVRFSCFESHWPKGKEEFSCYDTGYRTGYPYYQKIVRWDQGWQPWCRSRVKDATLKWLVAIFTTLMVILLIALIFIGCWGMKRKRIRQRRESNASTRMKKSNSATLPPPKDYTPLALTSPPYEHTKSEPLFNYIDQPPVAVVGNKRPSLTAISNDSGGVELSLPRNGTPSASLATPRHASKSAPPSPPLGYPASSHWSDSPPRYTTPPRHLSSLRGLDTAV